MAAEDTLVEESVDAPKRAPRARKGEVEDLSGKKVRLTIHKDPSPTAVDPVFVGVNFVGYAIKRGEEVIVPVEVVDVLIRRARGQDNIRRTGAEQRTDGVLSVFGALRVGLKAIGIKGHVVIGDIAGSGENRNHAFFQAAFPGNIRVV